MRCNTIVMIFLLVMSTATWSARAAESYANCTGTISSLPTTISTPGTWCLKSSLSTATSTGNAILIKADNVTLDCNDFVISGTAGPATGATGIRLSNLLNDTVRHCGVEGFRYGVYLQAATGGGHAVEDSRFDGNTQQGIHVEGDGSVVRRNLVTNTGATTVAKIVYGIYAIDSVDIKDNIVNRVTASTGSNGSAYGIYTTKDVAGSIDNNRVSGMAKDGTGKDYGVFNATSGRIALLGNTIFGDDSAGSVGLDCVNSSARAYDNELNSVATGLVGCGDAGRNDVSQH